MPGQAGYGVPNGVLNNDDFFYYLAQFAAGNPGHRGPDDNRHPRHIGLRRAGGVLNNDDFFYYLALFAQGC